MSTLKMRGFADADVYERGRLTASEGRHLETTVTVKSFVLNNTTTAPSTLTTATNPMTVALDARHLRSRAHADLPFISSRRSHSYANCPELR